MKAHEGSKPRRPPIGHLSGQWPLLKFVESSRTYSRHLDLLRNLHDKSDTVVLKVSTETIAAA